jgi:aminobutyraldehyde dehydrogenase
MTRYVPSRFDLLINGRMMTGDAASFDIINPATGLSFAEITAASSTQVDLAIGAAQRAFPGWARTPPRVRAAALLEVANRIEQQADALADIETRNVGKPRHLSQVTDVASTIDAFRFFAGAARTMSAAPAGEYRASHLTSMMRRDAIGVVAAITPWNYPLMMAAWKIAPALAAGNCVVLKPSEITPCSSLALGAIIADCLPPGVLNIVHGSGVIVGSQLINDPRIDMISLTGSVATGRHVLDAACAGLKKTHLELGGKAPAIILKDADIQTAARDLAEAAFYNTGQDCTAAARIYVAKAIYGSFVEKLAEAAASLRMGNPEERETDIGPLVSQAHLDSVYGFVERARKTATAVTGGTPADGPGFFYPPTVLTDVKQDDEIVREEVFGPVIACLPFEDESEAVRLANDTPYGMAASVWTNNAARGLEMATQLRTGATWINCHSLPCSEMPHGGFGASGHGVDLSAAGLEEYTLPRHIMVKH